VCLRFGTALLSFNTRVGFYLLCLGCGRGSDRFIQVLGDGANGNKHREKREGLWEGRGFCGSLGFVIDIGELKFPQFK